MLRLRGCSLAKNAEDAGADFAAAEMSTPAQDEKLWAAMERELQKKWSRVAGSGARQCRSYADEHFNGSRDRGGKKVF